MVLNCWLCTACADVLFTYVIVIGAVGLATELLIVIMSLTCIADECFSRLRLTSSTFFCSSGDMSVMKIGLHLCPMLVETSYNTRLTSALSENNRNSYISVCVALLSARFFTILVKRAIELTDIL